MSQKKQKTYMLKHLIQIKNGKIKHVNVSSKVNEAIKTISSQFFLRKDLEHAKSIKAQNNQFSFS